MTDMAVHQLLLRGMLAGFLAALLAFSFAKVYGEPQVDTAINFEYSMHEKEMAEAAKAGHPMQDDDPDIFSRATQASIGLFTGITIVGTALGGLFSLLFAFCYGRFSGLSPKAFAVVLALICFVAIHLVPDLKYPANPPSIGQPGTIGLRTALYFSMILISIIATVASFSLRRLFVSRHGAWNATLLGALAFVVMIAIAQYALPMVNEVPDGFPAQSLWKFRLDSLAIQFILWGGIGLLFGALTERNLSVHANRGARVLPSSV
jgi:hypothetical protein